MLEQTFAHIRGRDADDRIFAGVVSGRPAEKLHADDAFFERIKVAGDGLIHDIGEELGAAVTAFKRFAIKNFLKMMPESGDLFPGVRDFGDFRFAEVNQAGELSIMILLRHGVAARNEASGSW